MNDSDRDKNRHQVEDVYDQTINNAIGTNSIFSDAAKFQMHDMVLETLKADKLFSDISNTNQSIAVKAGFAAEASHAETFNLDAILKKITTRAYTDRSPEFGAPKNGIPDIKIIDEGKVIGQAQVKYYNNAEKTATAMRELDINGTPKYAGLQNIGPSEQISDIKDAAHRTTLSQAENRPNVAAGAQMVEKSATATLKSGNAESTPLSKADAEQLAKDPNSDVRIAKENLFKTKSTVRNMQQAALGAAALSSIVSGSINIAKYYSLVQEGKIDLSDAAIKIASETVVSAADSALKAAATTGAQSLIIRYGSEELARRMARQGIGAMLRSNVVSTAAICTIDLIKDVVLLGAGKITPQQLEERSGKNLLKTSAGSVGGSLGALACAGLVPVGGIAIFPIIGGLAGALICAMATELAVENGIEAPYRQLLENTSTLRDASRLLTELSEQFFNGQANFEQCLTVEECLDESFRRQMDQNAESARKMSTAIDRI